MTSKRRRYTYSIKNELVKKSREAMLAAVQIYNNPQITFKSEAFITLAIIAWTYLMHAYYRGEAVDYRYFRIVGKTKRYDKTNKGAFKHWELERCINCESCPLDQDTKNNLRFLIGIRHEIEHQMTKRIDEYICAKLQACAINYDYYLTKLFGEKHSVSDDLALTIQFSSISPTQEKQLRLADRLSCNVRNYISEFEDSLTEKEEKNSRYSYRLFYSPLSVNRKGQADHVFQFIKPDSVEAKEIERILIKQVEKPKHLPSGIVKILNEEGFDGFRIHDHTILWKTENAKAPAKRYGVAVGKHWFWYDSWLNFVRQHCKDNSDKYRKNVSEKKL